MNDRLKHDLCNLLTTLLGALELEDMPLAQRAGEQMAAMLRRPQVAEVSLNDLMREMAPLLGDVRLVLADTDVFVRADPTALGRVLMNLVVNARQAGGAVTLRVGQDGEHATIAVGDTGPGIPPDFLAHMFEEGFTTRGEAGGNGLGLTIVQEIVEEARGSVSAESTVGQGTTVTVRWPLAQRENESLPLPQGEGKVPPLTAMTVLLTEDDPIVRRLAERALSQDGWSVVAVRSAEEALTTVQTLTPDAIVADLTLPGMDGRTLIAAVRARWPKLPAVLVSGYADSARKADLKAEKVVFLAKPYPLDALVAAVKAAVRD